MKKLILYLVVFFLLFTISADAKEDKEKKGQQQVTATSSGSTGVDVGSPPDQQGQFGIESSSCTWWWLSGQHSWSWSGIPYLYISWSGYGKSWTEYGTSTGPCSGVPLTVDILYVGVTLYYRYEWENFLRIFTSFDNTAYNTSFADKSGSGWCGGPGCPTICGGSSYHEAHKNGVRWHAAAWSGCAVS